MTTTATEGIALSVVMTTRGDAALLGITVQAALQSGLDLSRDELLVAIDGPVAGAKGLVDQLTRLSSAVRVHVLPENRGAAGARLFGVTQARHDVVVLLDDDVALSPDALHEHRRFHAEAGSQPSLLVGAMPVAESDRDGIDDLPRQVYAEAYRETVEAWRVAPDMIAQTLWMGHLSVRREHLLAAETVLPSVRMDYFEDTDLGLRLAMVGVRMHYSDRARAEHHYGKDLASFLREAALRGRSAAVLGRRWPTVGVGPTAPSGQSMVRTVTSSLFRQRWVVRLSLAWLRSTAGPVSPRRRSQALLARHLVEQAWFDHELRVDHAPGELTPLRQPFDLATPLTSRFANSTRRA